MIQIIIQQTSPCKKSRQQGQNRNVLSFLRFAPLIFLLWACLLNAGQEYSRSDLVSKQDILPITLCSEYSTSLVFLMMCHNTPVYDVAEIGLYVLPGCSFRNLFLYITLAKGILIEFLLTQNFITELILKWNRIFQPVLFPQTF